MTTQAVEQYVLELIHLYLILFSFAVHKHC
jgi:hypothetical protein